jgi:hypothetical protein
MAEFPTATQGGAGLEDLTFDSFRPADAQGIAELFRAVYGEGYPIRLYYEPEELTRANQEGRCYSLVARDPKGKVVAVEHVFRSGPFGTIYEVGSGLTLKEYRKRGITKRLLGYVTEEFAPAMRSVEELFGEAVCNHTHTQKLVSELRHVETALEVALMPAEAYRAEKSASGRVAALLAFRCYRPKPQVVFVPPCYEAEFRFIYAALDDKRDVMKGAETRPRPDVTNASMEVFDFARVARIAVHETGKDLGPCIDRLLKTCDDKGVLVVQVWLGLNVPEIASPVEELRSRGFFFGGLLPRWFDHDGMLMQRLSCPPNFEMIQLLSDRAKRILEFVKSDWEGVLDDPTRAV